MVKRYNQLIDVLQKMFVGKSVVFGNLNDDARANICAIYVNITSESIMQSGLGGVDRLFELQGSIKLYSNGQCNLYKGYLGDTLIMSEHPTDITFGRNIQIEEFYNDTGNKIYNESVDFSYMVKESYNVNRLKEVFINGINK